MRVIQAGTPAAVRCSGPCDAQPSQSAAVPIGLQRTRVLIRSRAVVDALLCRPAQLLRRLLDFFARLQRMGLRYDFFLNLIGSLLSFGNILLALYYFKASHNMNKNAKPVLKKLLVNEDNI